MKLLISFLKSSEHQSKQQSLLVNGEQTSGELFSLDYPFIKGIKKAIEFEIEKYKIFFKNSQEGLIKYWPKSYKLKSWSVIMKKGGFLRPHNHTYGWISGSFYIQVPKSENHNDGNIEFSYKDPKLHDKGKDFPSIIKNVETRDLIIFPSSLFHHTIPFNSDEERICFVFDLVPIKEEYIISH